MSLIHRQWSRLKLRFYPHTMYPDAMRRKNAGIDVELSDVIQAGTHKDISQAAGSFSLTLVPRQEYLTTLRPNDWMELYLDNGKGPDKPLMVGSIDRISRRRAVDGKGSTKEVISVSGRDYGKVFLNTVIIVDPLIGAILDQTTFEQEVIISQFAKNDIPLNGPHEVIAELLKRYHDKRIQCTLPTSLNRHLVTHLSDKVRGRIVVNGNPNLSGNLWTTMQQYTNPVLNEFWVDTVDGEPTLYLEERPYSHDHFAELEAVEVDETEVMQEDLGKADTDIRNWIRLFPDAQYLPAELVNIAGLGYTDPYSSARAGIRKLEPTTNAFGEFNKKLVDVNMGIPSGLLQDWCESLAEWNVNNDALLAGTMTMRLRTDAHVGRRLDYTNKRTGEHLSFYIESVTHNFNYPGASTTSVNLTRGVEREAGALHFPTLRTIDELTLRDSWLQLLSKLNLDVLNNARVDAPEGQALV